MAADDHIDHLVARTEGALETHAPSERRQQYDYASQAGGLLSARQVRSATSSQHINVAEDFSIIALSSWRTAADGVQMMLRTPKQLTQGLIAVYKVLTAVTLIDFVNITLW